MVRQQFAVRLLLQVIKAELPALVADLRARIELL